METQNYLFYGTFFPLLFFFNTFFSICLFVLPNFLYLFLPRTVSWPIRAIRSSRHHIIVMDFDPNIIQEEVDGKNKTKQTTTMLSNFEEDRLHKKQTKNPKHNSPENYPLHLLPFFFVPVFIVLQ